MRATVEARGLVSVMSDTTWRELVAAVKKLPFAPAFQIKEVLAATPVPSSFDEDVWYAGDWDEGLSLFYSIEWIRVRPRILRHRGNNVSPAVEDIESAVVAALREVGVPHRKRDGGIAIFGYAESTAISTVKTPGFPPESSRVGQRDQPAPRLLLFDSSRRSKTLPRPCWPNSPSV